MIARSQFSGSVTAFKFANTDQEIGGLESWLDEPSQNADESLRFQARTWIAGTVTDVHSDRLTFDVKARMVTKKVVRPLNLRKDLLPFSGLRSNN